MNTEKVATYLLNRQSSLEKAYQHLEEDAYSCGPMSYEDRERRSYAISRRESIKEELNELKNLLEPW